MQGRRSGRRVLEMPTRSRVKRPSMNAPCGGPNLSSNRKEGAMITSRIEPGESHHRLSVRNSLAAQRGSGTGRPPAPERSDVRPPCVHRAHLPVLSGCDEMPSAAHLCGCIATRVHEVRRVQRLMCPAVARDGSPTIAECWSALGRGTAGQNPFRLSPLWFWVSRTENL